MAKYTIKSGDTKASLQKKFGIALNDKQYRSTDPNKLFAGETIDIGAAPGDAGFIGPINQQGQIDLSKVPADVKPIPEPVQPQVSVVKSKDNPDGTTTNFLSNGQTDVGKYTRNPDGSLSFVPVTTSGVQSFQDITFNDLEPEEQLSRTAQTIQKEIADIETRMATRSADRSDLLEDAGVFDDMKTLNELKAELRSSQDRELELPIETRQKLRGNRATKAEYNADLSPKLENNALRSLAASRNVARITDTINTNIAIIDQKIEAETARDEFLYKQKASRLENIQKVYGDIITEKQKAEIEAKKFQYDLTLEDIKSDNTLRRDLMKTLAEKGVAGQQLASYTNASTDELLKATMTISSPARWSEMTFEEGAMVLDKDTFKKFEAYKTWEKTATEEQKAAADQALAVTQGAASVVTLIGELLDDKQGLKTSVGTGGIGNWDLNPLWMGSESTQFRAKAKQLLSKETLDQLLELKAAGGTLGSITEKELDILSNAATALGAIFDDNGKATGRFKFKESDFELALKTMRLASMKTYIAGSMGKARFQAGNLQNANYETIEPLYKELLKSSPATQQNYYEQDIKGSTTTSPTSFSPSNSTTSPAFSTALNVIKENEGFKTEAYQDSAGVWTIGFGNTMINGRPVKPGDTISPSQATAMLQSSVIKNYTSFVDKVKSAITPNKFAALTSFEYNLGPGVWNQPTGKQILSLVNQGNYAEAGKLMLQYNKAKDPNTGQLKPIAGLTNRRMREAKLLLS